MLSRELLKRYLENRCTEEEIQWLKNYFARENPEELNRLLRDEWVSIHPEERDAISEYHRKRIWGRLAKEIDFEEVDTPLNEYPTENKNRRWWTGMAAAIVLCIVAIGLMKRSFMPMTSEVAAIESEEPMIEQKNTSHKALHLTLVDGSKVILEPNSTIKYAPEFSRAKRVVHLEGKAFFDVVKDSLSPFHVITNAVNVRVLGTSFNVTSFQDQPAEVSVVTGKVAVSVSGKDEETILRPNERVVQGLDNTELTKGLVAEPIVIRPELMHNLFHFQDVSLPEVFRVFEEAYDIRIKYDWDALQHCTINARLEDQSLFTKLKMICLSMGLSYEVSGTEIVITGKGC